MGGIIGVGIAAVGGDGVHWGWDGVSQIFAAWFIAPGISAGFAIIIFGITKYGVLERSRPLHYGLMMIPAYFGVTAAILTMVIVWKGGSLKSFLPARHGYLTISDSGLAGPGRLVRRSGCRMHIWGRWWCRSTVRHFPLALPIQKTRQGGLGAEGLGSHQGPVALEKRTRSSSSGRSH